MCWFNTPVNMQNYRATPPFLNLKQHHSPHHESKPGLLLLFFCLTSQWLYCSHLSQTICFCTYSLSYVSIIQVQVHPADHIQKAWCHPTDWKGRLDLFPLQSSQRMSQGHIISWSVKVTPSLITEVFLDSIKCDASAPWMKATDEISHFTTICVNSLQDKSKNTRLHNFHTSRGNFPLHTFKCNSNGVHEMFSFKIK